MNMIRNKWFPAIRRCLATTFTLGLITSSLAQVGVLPVVSIRATDPLATWSGDPGGFTFLREGPTNQTLNVFYLIRGTASNGVDYATIPDTTIIPAGMRTSSVVINPINNGQTIVKTVVLQLAPPPWVPPVNYSIGVPSNATVYISTGSNLPPVVRITSPPNGSVFRAPINLPVFAFAADPDGFVAAVEFFADSVSLGLGHPVRPTVSGTLFGPTNLWTLVWSNAPPGTNISLTAKATDNGGASTLSAPVSISILPPGPPPTNRPPIVSIVASDPIAIEGTNCWPWLGLAGVSPTWGNWICSNTFCRVFTNCGPKNAMFTVRRFGDTNGDITVTYAIGGTATNGVDYVALPGSVTIPSGQREALMPVVPIDDGTPDLSTTVILKLLPSAAVPPDYVLGFPRAAEAIILDKGPRPPTGMMPDGTFHLSNTGPDGAWFHVEYSTDMLNWTAICTNQVVGGGIDFVDPQAQADQARFYRAVPEAGPPQ
jgi:hypothetical protein